MRIMTETRFFKETFARLFVLAIQNKANFFSFTNSLAASVFLEKIEKGRYDDYFNRPLTDLFYDVTGNRIHEDKSYGVYNDAYWCGHCYFELFLRTRKPFAYLFLKLPLEKLMDLYPIYHEMDFSSLLEFFEKREKEKTILRLLCEQKKTTLPRLSEVTGIAVPTLSKYKVSDKALYRASFQMIMAIADYFEVPVNLFRESVPETL